MFKIPYSTRTSNTNQPTISNPTLSTQIFPQNKYNYNISYIIRPSPPIHMSNSTITTAKNPNATHKDPTSTHAHHPTHTNHTQFHRIPTNLHQIHHNNNKNTNFAIIPIKQPIQSNPNSYKSKKTLPHKQTPHKIHIHIELLPQMGRKETNTRVCWATESSKMGGN